MNPPAARLGLPTRLLDALVVGLNAVGSLWVVAVMALINADALSRFLFNRPLSGVALVAGISVAAIVYLQLAATLKDGRMTRSDLMIGRLVATRPGVGRTLEAAYSLAGAALMGVICAWGAPMLAQAWTDSLYSGMKGDFTLPEWPISLAILVSVAMCGVQYVVQLAGHLAAIVPAGKELRDALITAALLAGGLGALYVLQEAFSVGRVHVGLLSVGFVVLLVYAGVHIAIALALLSFACVWLIVGEARIAGELVALAAFQGLRRYEFAVIPLFVLMGLLVSASGIGKDTYEVANHLFRRLRGGLGHATVGANAVFAAITGTSIASASVFTRVAVPEMLKFGYTPRFSVGVVAGSSVLGMLIPPSMLMIVYGLIAETSIGALFMAGIVPGLVLAVAYGLMISAAARFAPRYVVSAPDAFRRQVASALTAREAWVKGFPILLLIGLVMGGIYGGVFTATEAGGAGALGALVLALARRSLGWDSFLRTLTEAGSVTAAICFLLVSAFIYTRMIALTGIPNAMDEFIRNAGLGLGEILVIYIAVLLVLGTIIDAGSSILITVPLVLPVLAPYDVDLVWFGIITVIAVEIGLLTPPLGIACFVVHANLRDPRITLWDVFAGATPFALVMLAVLALITLVPWLSLVLVR